MLLQFLSLPRTTQNRICTLLNTQCVLRMREVCNKTKNIIGIWAKTQKSIVRHLRIVEEENINDGILIEWKFARIRDCIFWKIRIVNSTSKHELSKFFSPSTLLTSPYTRIFQYNVSAKQAMQHFLWLKPFIIAAHFCEIILHNLLPKIFAAFADFIKQKNIPIVSIRYKSPARFEPKSMLQSIRMCKFNILIFLDIPQFPGFFEFLINLSEIVNEITFGMNVDVPFLLPICVVRNIFSRKCKKLHHFDLRLQCNSEHIEQLIKLFHHIGKKAQFQAGRSEHSYTVQIGKVKVESGGPIGLRISSM